MSGISWEKYKSQLRKIYFAESGLCWRDPAAADDFWIFFTKYQSVMTKKGVTIDMRLAEEGPNPHQTALNSLRLPVQYSKYYKQSSDFNLGKPERYALKTIPKHVITEFEVSEIFRAIFFTVSHPFSIFSTFCTVTWSFCSEKRCRS